MKTLAAIDGDILVYECGFASDAAAKATGMTNEPLGYCLNGVEMKIENLLKNTGADEYMIFLTGTPSVGVPHREQVFPEYKKNRDATHKPHWYKEIKNHLIRNHPNLVVLDGLEADDYLGAIGHQDNVEDGWHVVICSKDKDLDMIPGYHYNWSKTKIDKGIYYVNATEGMRFFCEQMLTGDSTDNIPGIFKLYGKKATAALKNPLLTLTAPIDMLAYVLQVYGGDTENFMRNGELLWIRPDVRQSFTDWWEKLAS